MLASASGLLIALAGVVAAAAALRRLGRRSGRARGGAASGGPGGGASGSASEATPASYTDPRHTLGIATLVIPFVAVAAVALLLLPWAAALRGGAATLPALLVAIPLCVVLFWARDGFEW